MTRHTIINGPSKFDIQHEFFDTPDAIVFGRRHRPSKFTLRDPNWDGGKPHMAQEISVVISGLSWVDHSGENWRFEGYYTIEFNEVPAPGERLVKGQYRTDNRQGYMDIDVVPSTT